MNISAIIAATILVAAVGLFIGVFLGSSLYQYLDYKAHPGLYEMQSAPWYTAIQIRGLFTVVLVVITLAVMAIIRKKMK